ncbi:unnamed protein product [Tenebrio molitor]|nr:unnamed protein product [Tenebrio molitor]
MSQYQFVPSNLTKVDQDEHDTVMATNQISFFTYKKRVRI